MPTVTPAPAAVRGAPIWLGMLVLYFVWGSTYLGIAIAVDIDPAVPHGGRPVPDRRARPPGLVRRARGPRVRRRPTRREWRDSAIVGALLLGGGMGLVAFGEQTVPSGIAALLIAMMPVWVAILGGIFLGERLPRLAVVGIAVGFAASRSSSGRPRSAASARSIRSGSSRCLLSPIAWATGSLFASHRASLPRRPLVATGSRCSSAALVLAAVGASSPARSRTFDIGRGDRAIRSLALAYLTVVGSLLAFTDVRLAAAGRAAAARDDLRVRQPGRRGHPRRHRPQRADRCRGPWSPVASSSSRSR